MCWCDLIRLDVMDCVGFSVISHVCFETRDELSVPVSLIQYYPPHQIEQWRHTWNKSDARDAWTGDCLVFHEACALVEDSQVRIWDPSESSWLNCTQSDRVAAVKVRLDDFRGTLTWDNKSLTPNSWTPLPSNLPD